jgi:hypothetical protein
MENNEKLQIPLEDILKGVETFAGKKPVRIILPKGVGFESERHPLETPIHELGKTYYFVYGGENIAHDYEIDLTKVDIIYPNTALPKSA